MVTNVSGQPDLVTILRRIEEHAHELSNWVGITMNLLARAAATDELEQAKNDVQVAADISNRSVGALKKLMLDLASMRTTLLR